MTSLLLKAYRTIPFYWLADNVKTYRASFEYPLKTHYYQLFFTQKATR
ncbi:hypothetical protein [Streptococcus dysgalactiae]|nr:hypothetical protein [Streptococcus dysgalactiae]